MIGLQIDTSSILSVLSIYNKPWSLQLKDLISAAIINIIWVIWFARNKIKFDDKIIPVRTAISIIKASSALTGNLSKNTMQVVDKEINILHLFGASLHPCKAPLIIKVDWIPPCCGWIKVNTDGAAKGSYGHAGGGAIF